MNILFLTPRNSKYSLGGVEQHVRLVAAELEMKGHRIEELSLELCKGQTSRMQGLSLRYKLRVWKYLLDHKDQILKTDVIHIHDIFWWYLPFRFLFPTKPVFTTFHGWEGECPPSWSAVLQKRLAQSLSRGTVGIGTFFQKWYGVKPGRTCWGVLSEELINRPIDKSTNRQMKKMKIAFFGRLEEVNGVDIALEAFRIVKGLTLPAQSQTLRNTEILFIGGGSARKEAEKIGHVTGMIKERWKLLSRAQIVVTSSYLCMLEAAVMIKPIIAIATNPLKRDYLMTHPLAPYITVVSSANELAECIRTVDVSTYRRKLLTARNWAIAQTPGKLANMYTDLWHSLQLIN